MARFDTSCLQSTVRNIANVPLTFSFLPPHGKTLQPGQEYSFDGYPIEAISRRDAQGGYAHITAFKSALSTSRLLLKKTPNPVVFDSGTGATKILDLHLGLLVARNPCWAESVFSA